LVRHVQDFDGDGDLDVYLVQGGPLPVPGAPLPAERPTNRLFLNDGTAHFTDATAESGAGAQRSYGMGAVAGDVDRDGDLDLYLSNLGPDVLLLNDGQARFTDGTAAAGLGDERWTTAATFFDADSDGDLDLFVTGYVQVDLEHPLWCGERRPGWRSYCHPDAYGGLPSRFWRNRGDGSFEEATAAAGLATEPDRPGKGLGAIAFDADRDGDLDLYQANDSVENRFWLNDGDGTFSDWTLVSGTGVDGQGRTEAGMGLATGDVDGDLDLDLVKTNFDDESDTLYRNDGGGLFTDVTIAAGLEAPTRLPVGFGTVLEDLDNDGDLDLVVANGHIIDNIELYHDAKTWKQLCQTYANDGSGSFTEATAQTGALGAERLVGRGLYAGDLDADGDLDLLLTQNGGPTRLYLNRGAPPGAAPGGSVELAGLAPGTWVLATLSSGRQLVRDAGAQTSYLGCGSSRVHLGLGADRLERLSLTPPGQPAVEIELAPPLTHGRLSFVNGSRAPALQDPAPAR
ncbi:MAG TPA: VCBS repeat-containing protein, partial [Planctomycetota bacterium]|nr:VCBS repeat-containing protein [Planctomycetota bacterium]